MATGQVSSTNITPWQLVSTVTTTTGTTATFSSLAGYKQYMLCWNGVTQSAGRIRLEFNGSTTNYVSQISVAGYQTSVNTSITLADTGTTADGFLNIYDVLTAGPKQVQGAGNNASQPGVITGIWNNTAAITSMVATTAGAYTAGTWTLYGIAA